ncbi:hypothetical protein PV10_01201 [Exophiala mesophila]|uniref:Glyoxalase-like domain-containing protein n=1 Tax=Exophiala mesophila TaxID=212818 RepID=A0A0D1X6J3_EXOME|nr:uncharacterized protein PV10_01201 [Exophiala mesophila]KIV97450.1 hypothetical protein PV10_01201 [Exophiala mesophila]
MKDPGSRPTRLRQIALIAEDLDRARHLLTTILDTEVVFIDPQVAQWGLKNILVAIGGDIIEVCSPFKPDTTVGRLLQKRGDGGYMIIMQTIDAVARRKYIESQKLAKVIFDHVHDDAVCIQYHPKGVPGGMMPELDSHTPSPKNPTPLDSPFSPWHACGADYLAYSTAMKRRAHLKLIGATLRLAPGNTNIQAAAQRWNHLFGVPSQANNLLFTNAKLDFVNGVQGQPEGLERITIQVDGKDRLERILNIARREGVYKDGAVEMLGVKWNFIVGDGDSSSDATVNRSRL